MKFYLNFSNLDIYSKKICFFYKNQEKISSFFGIFLTLVYILASIILFIFQIVRAIQRNELKVYDTTIYSQEMPIIDVDINSLYFAFGLEYPNTATRYIDEGIYTAKITFFDKQKKEDDFVTVTEKDLEFEKCNMDNFGENYKNLFVKDELNNSYCLKNFNYSLTFAGSYKYERITYIRIVVYPCVNSTKNNYSCKPQEVIDKHLNSGYFSIVLKDFGLNPSNYTSPIIPTLQDLYTTIDRRLSKNYILNFGLTEIHTDTGIITQNINKEKKLQFRKVLENFSLRNEKDYYSGKSLILVQLRLEDTVFVQTRTYTKIDEILSRIGGYMQLMNTVFLLITTMFNRIYSQITIINSIFNFNIKENKILLRLKSFKDSNKILNFGNIKNMNFNSEKDISTKLECGNKSKNNLILKVNDSHNNISSLNLSDNKKINENQQAKRNKNKIIISFEEPKCDYKNVNPPFWGSNYKNSKGENLQKIYDFKDSEYYKYPNFNDYINLNIFDYFCTPKGSKKYKRIKLYNIGSAFYKKKMDIVNVFTLLTLFEEFLKK